MSGAMAWMDRVPDAIAILFCVVGVVALWMSDWRGKSGERS